MQMMRRLWRWVWQLTLALVLLSVALVSRLGAPGTILATEKSKGILRDVLRPGKYRVNPFAYSLKMANAIQIRPGHVGVVTSLSGKDVMNSSLPAELRIKRDALELQIESLRAQLDALGKELWRSIGQLDIAKLRGSLK
jgi:hypothetical protein